MTYKLGTIGGGIWGLGRAGPWETCALRFMSDFCLYSVTKEPQSSEHCAWEVSTASLLGRMPRDGKGRS